MLGAVGFLGLAVALGFYAYTSALLYRLVPPFKRALFVGAYSVLSAAALVWLATFFVPDSAVPALVFMSDVMLVAASVGMLAIVVDLSRPLVISLVALLAAGLLTLRAYTIPSNAYIGDGLLLFNLTTLESTVIGLLFLGIWLPATIWVVSRAFDTPKYSALRNPITFVFISAVLMTSFFLSARRPSLIIISFVSIVLMFTVLGFMNLALGREVVRTPRKKSHAKR